jgi:hypothetical protein
MKFIIYICTRLRHGQFPRLPDFPYSEEYGKFIYQGQSLDATQLNEVAPIVFDPNYRSGGFAFCVEAIIPLTETEKEAPEKEAPEKEAPESEFRIVDGEIFKGDDKIGGFSDPENHLRMTRGHAGLREEVEAWIESTT